MLEAYILNAAKTMAIPINAPQAHRAKAHFTTRRVISRAEGTFHARSAFHSPAGETP